MMGAELEQWQWPDPRARAEAAGSASSSGGDGRANQRAAEPDDASASRGVHSGVASMGRCKVAVHGGTVPTLIWLMKSLHSGPKRSQNGAEELDDVV
ncbi:hypothetical protein PR202_ga29195 [Eleusine coracana subsp. coracana]|uniref:Uncharacterized protein n=1 Tax=Eleusine coracana subsp. coracana TaxID=191504 RepID=A0AAV5DLD7_ELECO|nr:hypothetical protein PR202_ga29195 [Eleusine coracana subsp. coracana]